MKTIKVNVYQYDELSDESKQNACDYVRENWHNFYAWHNDNQKSINEFADFLGGVADFEVSLWGRSYAKIKDLDLDYAEEVILSNKELIGKSCPFTGYCADEDLLYPVEKYLENPEGKSLDQVIQEGCDNWVKNYVGDWEHCYTDEYIADFFMANEFEFTEDGKIWKM
jgi:hypothetical protein